eukprot:5084441-Pleurochrysis_carterae.AAC.1
MPRRFAAEGYGAGMTKQKGAALNLWWSHRSHPAESPRINDEGLTAVPLHLSPLEQTTRRSTDGSLSTRVVRFAGESAGIEALESKMAELKQQ